jgi:hypothetical protein
VTSRNSQDYQPDNEIYTTPEIFEKLGLIFDLDVCAPIGGLPWIPAKRSFSVLDDGLSQPWQGLVWCNPPYSKPKPWIERFIEHDNGIMLVQIARSKGADMLWNYADGIAFQGAGFKFTDNQMRRRTIFMPVAFYSMGRIATEALKQSGLGRVR